MALSNVRKSTTVTYFSGYFSHRVSNGKRESGTARTLDVVAMALHRDDGVNMDRKAGLNGHLTGSEWSTISRQTVSDDFESWLAFAATDSYLYSGCLTCAING